MEQKEIRQAFIQSAIHVVAQQGLVRATTKAIAAAAGLNEAYIYKCFRGKDELLAAALWKMDEGLTNHIGETFPIMRDAALTTPPSHGRSGASSSGSASGNSFCRRTMNASSISGIITPPTSAPVRGRSICSITAR